MNSSLLYTRALALLVSLVAVGNISLAQADAAPKPTGLTVGTLAPAIEGIDHRGTPVSLAALIKQGPVVVTFYRGLWCPFCNAYLKRLEDSVSRAGGAVIAVTPETSALARQTAEKTGASYPIISDTSGRLLGAYQVGFAVDAATAEKYKSYGVDIAANNGGRLVLPVPATYVVGTDGRIRFVHFDANYRKRAAVSDLKAAR